MGGVCISAKDLAKMTSILINDGMYQGERYLTEKSVERMETAYCMGSQHGVSFVQCMPLDYKRTAMPCCRIIQKIKMELLY